jgi:hypothetical protein
MDYFASAPLVRLAGIFKMSDRIHALEKEPDQSIQLRLDLDCSRSPSRRRALAATGSRCRNVGMRFRICGNT